LGDAVDEFRHLSGEESKERLTLILARVDTDKDGLVRQVEDTVLVYLEFYQVM